MSPQSAGSNREDKGKKGKKGKTKEEAAKKQQQKPKPLRRAAGGGKETLPAGIVLHEAQEPALEELQEDKVRSGMGNGIMEQEDGKVRSRVRR